MNKRKLFLVGMIIVLFLLILYFFTNSSDKYNLTVDLTNSLNVKDYHVAGDGKTDDTVNFQRALDDAAKKNKILIVPANTYLVSPLKYRDPSSSDWWCLNVPSNSQIYFEPGAKLLLIDDAPSWTRVLVMDSVSNINIFGLVEIDGNAATVTNGNEHMAGIFIFNAQNIYIESAYSYNTYGDNLFIGGTEDEYSDNVKIDHFRGVTAGRKNLVIHYVDDLYIKTAILDNSMGGTENNWSGNNSLDLEPDDYKGSKSFYQKIDYLSTYGMGNDFTVGTHKKLSKKWVLEVGTFNVILMDKATIGLLSYAVTVKIDKLYLKSAEKNENIGLHLSFAANWEINEAYLVGGTGQAILAKQEYGEKPNIAIGKIFISRPLGSGLELWGADATIEYFEANTIGNNVLYVYSTDEQAVNIQNLIIRDSGNTEIIFISDYGFVPHVQIDELTIFDSRPNKANNIFFLYSQKAVDGLEIGNIRNYDHIPEKEFGPAVQMKIN